MKVKDLLSQKDGHYTIEYYDFVINATIETNETSRFIWFGFVEKGFMFESSFFVENGKPFDYRLFEKIEFLASLNPMNLSKCNLKTPC